jgi:hypothetical protein
MIHLLITLLILLLVFAVAWWALTMIPLPEPVALVARVVFAIIMLIVLLTYLLPMAGVSLR